MENDFRKHILHYYNRAAHRYDAIEFIRKGTRRKVIENSGIRPGEKFLDICTGTGDLALSFAKAGALVTGIDIADNMLKRAEQKTNGFKATWLLMDATQLKFADKTFDIAAISLALHHMPENVQLRVLSEIRRVTRRKIITVEPHTPFKKQLRRPWGVVASVIDESEYMQQWAIQDFNQTCQNAGLQVESYEIMTFAIHRITVCKPMV